uniref:Uncharacterized protein n=1 Tax=Salix viminalis TaxID=40686 RepID=A0A6N2N044_SALVM
MHKGHEYLEYFLTFMVIAPSGKFTVLHLIWFVPVQWIVEYGNRCFRFVQVYSRKSAVGTFNICFVK